MNRALLDVFRRVGALAASPTARRRRRLWWKVATALTSYLETLKALGRPAPMAGAAFGGQWRQRVPKSLHAALARRAASEGVSLNLLVTTILAEGLGRWSGSNPA